MSQIWISRLVAEHPDGTLAEYNVAVWGKAEDVARLAAEQLARRGAEVRHGGIRPP